MKKKIRNKSLEAGYTNSVLPEFTAEQSQYLKETLDFIGINIYTSQVVTFSKEKSGSVSWAKSMGVDRTQPGSWQSTGTSWLKVMYLIKIGFYECI